MNTTIASTHEAGPPLDFARARGQISVLLGRAGHLDVLDGLHAHRTGAQVQA